MKSHEILEKTFLNLRTQPRLFAVWLIWAINLAGNGLVFYFLMPRSLADIYPQYQFQIAYPGVLEFLTPQQVAQLMLVQDYLVFGAFAGLALFLAWRKPTDTLALLISALFITGGVQTSTVTFIESRYQGMAGFSWLDPLQNLLNFLSLYGLGVFIFIFPDGRFMPHFLGRWVGGYLFISMAGLFLLQKPLGDEAYGLVLVNLLILFLSGLASQVYRYHYRSTALQRQQTKFVLLGLAAYPMLGLVFVVFISQLVPLAYKSFYNFVVQNLGFVALVLIPLTLTTSIFRHRLWDIDVIVRRTLQYTLLTGLLTVLYFSGIALLQNLLTADSRSWMAGEAAAIGDQPPAGVIVVTTLFIAALFNPLRRRIQDFIDWRFYRRKYDAEQALADFATEARNETDLMNLSTRLISTVQETLQPEEISLWIKRT